MNNDLSNNINTIEWSKNHEKILVEWADKAICYQWLHTRSHTKFSKSNALFTIPVIIMSTITGTANFAQDRFSPSVRTYIPVIIGSINIFAGILTTIQQYLKISELNEAHRVASIAWGKFYRNSKVELSKSPKERSDVLQMLKQSKEEFDRLIETSPNISEDVILDFKNTFSDTSKKIKKNKNENIINEISEKQKKYLELKKPEICGTIETTLNFVYTSDSDSESENDIVNNLNNTLSNTLSNSLTNSLNNYENKIITESININNKNETINTINNIYNKYYEKNLIYPNIDEIINELDFDIDIEIIKKFLEEKQNIV